MTEPLGLIVGSGFAELGLAVTARSPAKTPYGAPSAALLTTSIGGVRVLCLPRHGEEHTLAPHEINYRANLWALWQSGVRRCVALNTVGAIAAEFEPGGLAVPDQIVDYTHGRVATFGGEGRPVVHVDFTQPFDPDLRGALIAAVAACGERAVAGCYGVTQGPRLETAAEIARLARDGCAMVGMTAMPEAGLARELGLRYAILALAVNRAAGTGPAGGDIGAEMGRFRAAGMRNLVAVLAAAIPLVAATGVASRTVT